MIIMSRPQSDDSRIMIKIQLNTDRKLHSYPTDKATINNTLCYAISSPGVLTNKKTCTYVGQI